MSELGNFLNFCLQFMKPVNLAQKQTRKKPTKTKFLNLFFFRPKLRSKLAIAIVGQVVATSAGCTSAYSGQQSGYELVFQMSYSEMEKLIVDSNDRPLTQGELEEQIQLTSTSGCVPSDAKLFNSFTYVGWNSYPPDQPMSDQIVRRVSCLSLGRPELSAHRIPLMVLFQNPISNRSVIDIRTWGSKSELVQDPILKKYAREVQHAVPNDVDKCQIVAKEIVESGIKKTLFIALVTYPDTVASPFNGRLMGQAACYHLPLFLSAGVSEKSLTAVVKEIKPDIFLNASDRLLLLIRRRILDAKPSVPTPSQQPS